MMWFSLLAILASLLTLLLAAVTARQLLRSQQQAGATLRRLVERDCAEHEIAALAERREMIGAAGLVVRTLASAVMDDGTRAVREVHKEIASVPFDVLEAIPPTRDVAKVVRQVHDITADGVYGTISLFGRMLKPKDIPPARPAKTALPDPAKTEEQQLDNKSAQAQGSRGESKARRTNSAAPSQPDQPDDD